MKTYSIISNTMDVYKKAPVFSSEATLYFEAKFSPLIFKIVPTTGIRQLSGLYIYTYTFILLGLCMVFLFSEDSTKIDELSERIKDIEVIHKDYLCNIPLEASFIPLVMPYYINQQGLCMFSEDSTKIDELSEHIKDIEVIHQD